MDPSQLKDSVVAAGHRLADAARAADWPTLADLLDDENHLLNVNQVRPGGRSWFTVLHQAAWHDAPRAVVEDLLRRGALRTVRDARGRTAHDVAVGRHGPRSALLDLLAPPAPPLTADRERALDEHLGRVIDARLDTDGIARGHGLSSARRVLRYPPAGILHEPPGQQVWFPVPGMYG